MKVKVTGINYDLSKEDIFAYGLDELGLSDSDIEDNYNDVKDKLIEENHLLSNLIFKIKDDATDEEIIDKIGDITGYCVNSVESIIRL